MSFQKSSRKNRVRVAIIRGAFLNPFELQNYYPLKNNILWSVRKIPHFEEAEGPKYLYIGGKSVAL